LQQFPPGVELQTKPPSTVDVRVRGGSGALSRLSPVDIVAVLDLRGAQVGQRLFHLTPDQVRIPFGVEVVQITPPTIALLFERSAAVNVQVLPAPLERAFRSLPVHFRNLTPRLTAKIMPTTVDVSVRGSRESLVGVGVDDVSVYVDLAGLGVGEYSLRVHVD